MITVQSEQQLDQFYDICKDWIGIRYRMTKNGPEIYANAWTMLVDIFKWIKNCFK